MIRAVVLQILALCCGTLFVQFHTLDKTLVALRLLPQLGHGYLTKLNHVSYDLMHHRAWSALVILALQR